MLKSTVFVSALALAAGSTIGIAAPAQADIVDFIVYHSLSYTQDASGLSAAVASVQASVLTNVKGEFDGGSMTAPDSSVATVINQSSSGYPLDQFGAYFGPQPFGTFTVNLSNSVTLATGSASLSYTSDHYPDVAPEVSNYAALQHFDPTKDNSIVLTSGFTVPGDAPAHRRPFSSTMKRRWIACFNTASLRTPPCSTFRRTPPALAKRLAITSSSTLITTPPTSTASRT